MKKIIFAFFFLLSPFSTYGNTDNQLILSKNDTNKMFEMSMKEWVANVKKLKEIGATGGLIAIDKDANISTPFNTAGMVRGSITNKIDLSVEIY